MQWGRFKLTYLELDFNAFTNRINLVRSEHTFSIERHWEMVEIASTNRFTSVFQYFSFFLWWLGINFLYQLQLERLSYSCITLFHCTAETFCKTNWSSNWLLLICERQLIRSELKTDLFDVAEVLPVPGTVKWSRVPKTIAKLCHMYVYTDHSKIDGYDTYGQPWAGAFTGAKRILHLGCVLRCTSEVALPCSAILPRRKFVTCKRTEERTLTS